MRSAPSSMLRRPRNVLQQMAMSCSVSRMRHHQATAFFANMRSRCGFQSTPDCVPNGYSTAVRFDQPSEDMVLVIDNKILP